MPVYISPAGNPEIWDIQPIGYVTPEEWSFAHLAPETEPISLKDREVQFVNAIQNRLDVFARSRRYDNIISACTYAASSVPQFRCEGQYCVSARDATWATCYSILGAVLSGERPMPALEEVLAELPSLVWPEVVYA